MTCEPVDLSRYRAVARPPSKPRVVDAAEKASPLESAAPQLDALRGLILRDDALATVLRALERQKTRAALRIMQGRWIAPQTFIEDFDELKEAAAEAEELLRQARQAERLDGPTPPKGGAA